MLKLIRSSRSQMFFKLGVLENFTTYNFIKKETLAHVLSCEFCEIFKNTFLTEHLWIAASDLCRETYHGLYKVQNWEFCPILDVWQGSKNIPYPHWRKVAQVQYLKFFCIDHIYTNGIGKILKKINYWVQKQIIHFKLNYSCCP